MKNLWGAGIIGLFILFGCSNPVEVQEPVSNSWVIIEDRIVFYSELNMGYGGYGYTPGVEQNLTGTGKIDIDVYKVQGNSDVEFGINYRHPDIWGQQFSFCLKSGGSYNIGWVDDSGVNGVNADYYETDWTSSGAINTGLNVRNVLSISYDTSARTYVFLINDTEVFTKTFDYIDTGNVSYYCTLGADTSASTPYRFEYRTTTPFVFP